MILSEEYFYKNIVKFNVEKVQEVIVYKENYYKTFYISKKTGQRKISSVSQFSDLGVMQKNILNNFLIKIPLPLCVKGFVKNSSYIEYLNEHINKKFYMRIDIKDFFDSITNEQIRDNLFEYIKVFDVLDYCVELFTYKNKLPQGAITSPAISNIVFRRIDQRIIKYCQRFDITYTRYADDLLFSSNELNFKTQQWFYNKIKYILGENNFRCNCSKKHLEENKICLGGHVIQNDIHLSRKKLKNLNKILYYFKDFSNTSKYIVNYKLFQKDYLAEIKKLNIVDKRKFNKKEDLINYLCGYRSFIISIVKVNDINKNNLNNKIKQLESLIRAVESHG